MDEDKKKIISQKFSDTFYKLVLIGSQGLSSDSSDQSFRLNSQFEKFKGLCLVVVEQIILQQCTLRSDTATTPAVYFHLGSTQPYSQKNSIVANQYLDNNSSLLYAMPISQPNTATYFYDGQGKTASAIICNIVEDIINIRVLDELNVKIDESNYINYSIVLRVYPIR